MKKLILITLLGLFSITGYSKDITIHVMGMVCDLCSQGIQKKFGSLPSVENVQVSLENKIVKVKTKNETDIPDVEIQKLIEESGFNVKNIERE